MKYKGTDHLGHPRSLISTLVNVCRDIIIELRYEKTGFLQMRNQRRRSASR